VLCEIRTAYLSVIYKNTILHEDRRAKPGNLQKQCSFGRRGAVSQWIGEYFHILSFFEDLKRITYYYVVSELPHIVHSSTVV